MNVTRRTFLLLRVGSDRVVELSCERLFMKFVDAQMDGTTSALFARLDEELAEVSELRLVDTEWLGRDDFRQALDGALDARRAHGLIVSSRA